MRLVHVLENIDLLSNQGPPPTRETLDEFIRMNNSWIRNCRGYQRALDLLLDKGVELGLIVRASLSRSLHDQYRVTPQGLRIIRMERRKEQSEGEEWHYYHYPASWIIDCIIRADIGGDVGRNQVFFNTTNLHDDLSLYSIHRSSMSM